MSMGNNKKKKIKSTSAKQSKKKCGGKCANKCVREKVCGDPAPVQHVEKIINQPRPVSEYYNLETGEIYPKIFFKESWWTRFKRFLGLVS
jgi:hypothetical protein